MTSLLIRVDTIVNTNVKGSKVFGLAFVKVAGVTDVFTQDEIRAFVLPKLSEPDLVGSAIVQLDNVSSGENTNHSGRGDERFTGVLTKVFSNGIVDDTVTTNMADVTGAAGVDVYFLTMDGINETAVKSSYVTPFTFTIDGNEYSRSASDPLYQITLDEDTDADLTKTPWVLVLNYVHLGGTNPALNIRDTTKGLPVLPSDGTLDFGNVTINGTISDGSVANPGSWGHTGNDLFDKTCIALGSASGNQNGLEIRVVGKSGKPGNDRLIHFKSGFHILLNDHRYGNEPQVVYRTSENNKFSDFTLLDGHTAYFPDTDILVLYTGVNDQAMTSLGYVSVAGSANYAFYIGTDGRWEADDTFSGATNNTYHQIWVRADKA
jgi:hypothetical protein